MKRCEGFNCTKKSDCLNYLEKDEARKGMPGVTRWPFPYPEGQQPPECTDFNPTPKVRPAAPWPTPQPLK